MARDVTRTAARFVLVAAIIAIAIGYASAFAQGGAPTWAPWLLATGIPAALVAIMALGAARGSTGLGSLKIPLAFVFVVLTAGFCLALAIPSPEQQPELFILGLPLRAAIIIYGIGLLPIVVLPVAYAITFHTQTLREEDLARVRNTAANAGAQRNSAIAK